MLESRKSLILALVFALVLSLVLVLVGCTGSRAAVGTSAGNANATPNDAAAEQSSNSSQIETSQRPQQEDSIKIEKISDILAKPDVYKGQAIVVKGKIASECGSGCWFTLNDGTGTIYVDLKPSNFVIPQKRGAAATVYGVVTRASGDTYLIGKKVEF